MGTDNELRQEKLDEEVMSIKKGIYYEKVSKNISSSNEQGFNH